MVKVLNKYTQLNSVSDVWAPKYFTKEVYIAKRKVNRSKLPIKLKFAKVSRTSDYAGYWYIEPKKVRSFKKSYNNDGVDCYVVPWEAFERLEISHIDREAW